MPEVSEWYLLSSLLTEVGLGSAAGLLLKHISIAGSGVRAGFRFSGAVGA